MASANVVKVTDSNFESEVLKSDKPVLLDMGAEEWCPPCRALAPVIDALADEYQGKVKVGKLNTDENRQTAMHFSIQNIPTVVLVKNGQVVQRWTGFTAKKILKTGIDGALGQPA